jgi:hypothetical protein
MAGVFGFEQNQSGQQQPVDFDGNTRSVGVWGDSDTDIGVLGTSGAVPTGEVDSPTPFPAGIYARSWSPEAGAIESAAVVGEGMNDMGVLGLGRRGLAGVVAVGADTYGGGGGFTDIGFQGAGAFCQGYHGVVALGLGTGPGPGSAGVYAEGFGGGDGVQGDSSEGNGVHGETTFGTAVLGEAVRSGGGPPGIGVHGVSRRGPGVLGFTQDHIGTAGAALGSGFGVYGLQLSPEAGSGVVGASNIGDGITGIAVTGVGVRGECRRGLAGLFEGDVNIAGSLTVDGPIFKSGGGFEIDHPLDPEHMVLRHSFVESPDMLNVYSGTVTTDDNGEAVVELPDYIEALNRDFRYQLTVVGQFAQAVVLHEVRDGRFTVATDHPNVKVCWQVTGVRRDQWADEHRIEVEKTRPTSKHGADGQDPSAGTDRISAIIATFPAPVQDQLREVMSGERLDTADIENVVARTSEILFQPRPDRAAFEEKLRQITERIAHLRAQFGGGAEAT